MNVASVMTRLSAVLLFAAATTAQTSNNSYKDLKYPALSPVKIPRIEQFTLPNGMRVFLLENHELPFLGGFALIRTGNLFDPADRIGLASLTGDLIRSGGTPDKTGDQLDVALEDVAASVESSIGESNATVSFQTLTEHASTVLPLFRDVLTNPAFRQDKLDLLKTQTKAFIGRRNDDASSILSRETAALLYGKRTPYGWDSEPAMIDRIETADCRSFYQRYFFPANTILAIQGDFSTAEMKATLTVLFADWKVQQQPVPNFPSVSPRTARPGRVFLASKDDVTQTFFSVGQLGGVFRDADYPALQVMGNILGGGFSSRLFVRIRTQLGLAYDISGGWGATYDHPGLFLVSGSTQSANTVQALQAARQEIERMRATPVTPQELETAKSTILNSFVFNFDRPSKTLNRLVTYTYFGYPPDFISRYQQALAAVTIADVQRVANQYLQPSQLDVIAVGNPAAFGVPLSRVGPVYDVDLDHPQAEPKPQPASPSAPEQTNPTASEPAAIALLKQMQAAMGGADRLAAIKDATYSAESKFQGGAGTFSATQLSRWIATGMLRQDQKLSFGDVTVYYDGKTGWIATPQGNAPLSGPPLKQMANELFRYLPSLVLSDAVQGRTVRLAGPAAVRIADAQGHQLTLAIDPVSHLPLSQTYSGEQLNSSGDVTDTYSDWREIAGVKVPFSIAVQSTAGNGTTTISSWKFNTGLDASQLGKRP